MFTHKVITYIGKDNNIFYAIALHATNHNQEEYKNNCNEFRKLTTELFDKFHYGFGYHGIPLKGDTWEDLQNYDPYFKNFRKCDMEEFRSIVERCEELKQKES